MEDKIKLIIADDHQIFLEGLGALVKNIPSLELVGLAFNGQHALQLIEENQVDVAVLDIEMPVLDGVDATREIKKKYPDVKVLILSMYNTESFILQIMDAGASGYILKNNGGKELLTALQTVKSGGEYFSQNVKDTLFKSLKQKRQLPKKTKLTKREMEILRLIGEGNTSPQIAQQLYIAKSTVDTHRKNLIDKLGVEGTPGLVRYAVKRGLVK